MCLYTSSPFIEKPFHYLAGKRNKLYLAKNYLIYVMDQYIHQIVKNFYQIFQPDFLEAQINF